MSNAPWLDAFRGRDERHPPAPTSFTLLEVLIVLAIVSVLATIAVPRFTTSMNKCRADAAAQRIAADVDLARRAARASSASRRIEFNVAGDEYWIVGEADLDRSRQNYNVKLRNDPFCADLVSANLGGDATIVFDGFGEADSGGAVIISVGAEARTIQIGAGARVSIAKGIFAE